MDKKQFESLLNQEIAQMCQIAITEDLAGKGNEDITANLIHKDKQAKATLITREPAVLCGTQWVEEIFRMLGCNVEITWYFKDGDKLKANDEICHLKGNARSLLTGERSAMNFLQTLSATATNTKNHQRLLKGTNCKLLDTRKTIPGMRFGQKYAVACGGGQNHRLGLSDAFLIKENHILACGGITQSIQNAKAAHPDKLLEIEVENLNELYEALEGGAQVIMLDNFDIQQLTSAVKTRDEHVNQAKLEASGNVSTQNLAEIAETGVDFISVGALTKNIQAIDLSMRITLVDD